MTTFRCKTLSLLFAATLSGGCRPPPQPTVADGDQEYEITANDENDALVRNIFAGNYVTPLDPRGEMNRLNEESLARAKAATALQQTLHDAEVSELRRRVDDLERGQRLRDAERYAQQAQGK